MERFSLITPAEGEGGTGPAGAQGPLGPPGPHAMAISFKTLCLRQGQGPRSQGLGLGALRLAALLTQLSWDRSDSKGAAAEDARRKTAHARARQTLSLQTVLSPKGARRCSKDVMQPTRWLIEPHGKVRLLLKFFSEELSSAGCCRYVLPLAHRRVHHKPAGAHVLFLLKLNRSGACG